MKKWLVLVGVLLALAGGYLGVAHVSGGAFPTLGLPLGGARGELRRTAVSFWEDIQFKDFDRAATYHAPEKQDAVDIPYILQRIFLVKPEMLDIMEYEVVLCDIDSTGDRGRVKTRLKVKDLALGKVREREVMLYFQREDPAAPWYMELEDSLRHLDADKDKKH